MARERALFSFGVITDVQYADVPDGRSFHGIPRYYRHSLEALKAAVCSWNQQPDLSFVMQLGDIVDGKCPKQESVAAALKVVSAMERFRGGPIYHILGNHCLYNLPRHRLNELLKMPSCEDDAGCSYYAFSPHPGFRFVILDAYDVSVIGWPGDHPKATSARAMLAAKNPNDDKNCPSGMAAQEQRFVMFNGGVGEQQLRWLDKTLRCASDAQERVILGCHVPLLADATFADTLLWNAEEVLQTVHRYGCVVACFAGHKHEGGYAVDEQGIHHRVLEAVLECPPGDNAFGRVDVYGDRIELLGWGRMLSTEMIFSRRR